MIPIRRKSIAAWRCRDRARRGARRHAAALGRLARGRLAARPRRPGAARRGAAELARAARAVRRGSRARLPAAERAGLGGAAAAAGRGRAARRLHRRARGARRGSPSPSSARPGGSRRSKPGPARSSGCSRGSARTRGSSARWQTCRPDGEPRAHRPPARGAARAARPHRRGARAVQPPPGVARGADGDRARAAQPERVAAGARLRGARPAGPRSAAGGPRLRAFAGARRGRTPVSAASSTRAAESWSIHASRRSSSVLSATPLTSLRRRRRDLALVVVEHELALGERHRDRDDRSARPGSPLRCTFTRSGKASVSFFARISTKLFRSSWSARRYPARMSICGSGLVAGHGRIVSDQPSL